MLLLDTDTTTLLLYGRNARVRARVAALPDGERSAIALITRIEILRGRFDSVLKAGSKEELLTAQQRLYDTERWLAGVEVVAIDDAAANHFDRLRTIRKLKKFGRADLLIACIALAHDAILVTRNIKDYQPIPGLKLDNWAD